MVTEDPSTRTCSHRTGCRCPRWETLIPCVAGRLCSLCVCVCYEYHQCVCAFWPVCTLLGEKIACVSSDDDICADWVFLCAGSWGNRYDVCHTQACIHSCRGWPCMYKTHMRSYIHTNILHEHVKNARKRYQAHARVWVCVSICALLICLYIDSWFAYMLTQYAHFVFFGMHVHLLCRRGTYLGGESCLQYHVYMHVCMHIYIYIHTRWRGAFHGGQSCLAWLCMYVCMHVCVHS